ncbi:MAG: rod shape-determining protein MreC [Clostridiales bacterium]|jgi:rod shape-determining protein MreC|nr:rod shape-determining protein MreC [Clostridiales bacterium]
MEFLKRHKRLFLGIMSALCIVAAFVTINTDIRLSVVRNVAAYVINPLQNGLSSSANWVGDRINFFITMGSLYDENKRLRAENEDLTLEINRLRLAESDNKMLSQLLELDREYAQYSKTGAKITDKDPDDWIDVYTINKGASDGLALNMIALAPGGLMGIITHCGINSSTVRSIIDSRSSVTAKCMRTGDIGYVKGDSVLMREGLCRMSLIDYAAEILEGDEIVTAPMSAYYPAGITIGHVLSVESDPNGLTKHAIIQPSASLYRLETLLIVTEQKDAPVPEANE